MNLLDLTDDALVTILSYLDASELYDVSRASNRLDQLVKSPYFWRSFDARRTPNRYGKVDYICERIFCKTKEARFRGDNQDDYLIRDFVFEKLCAFDYITILVLENQRIDGCRVCLANFPLSLVELSLRRTVIEANEIFFKFAGEIMYNLRVLILNECNWVESCNLMSIAKFPNLEILSIYKCQNILYSIAYMSLSMRSGFKKLKILDARLTPIGESLLRYISENKTLIAFYIQNDDVSYELDWLKRKLDLANGAKPIDKYYVENNEFELFDENDENPYSNQRRKGHVNLNNFLRSESANTSEPMPKTVLYQDPYGECTCRFNRPTTENNGDENEPPTESPQSSTPSSSDDDDDSDNDDNSIDKAKLIKLLTKQIRMCKKIVYTDPPVFDETNNRRLFAPLRLARTPAMVRAHYFRTLNESDDQPPDTRRSISSLRKRTYSEAGCSYNNNDSDNGNNKKNKMENTKMRKRLKCFSPERDNPNIPEHMLPGSSKIRLGCKCSELKEDGDDALCLKNAQRIIIAPLEDQQDGIPIVRMLRRDPRLNEDELADRIEVNVMALLGGLHAGIFPPALNKAKISLKRLSLRGFHCIDDNSLNILKNVNLSLLDLTYTNVTQIGIQRYLDYHPNCRIIHEKYCTCRPKLHF